MGTLLFPFRQHETLAREVQELLGLERGEFELRRFASSELHVSLQSEPGGRRCVVLGDISPPEENLLAALLLCDTLRREGAIEIFLALPYLAYSRQDKAEHLESRAGVLMGHLFRAAGASKVLTIDLHSRTTAELFPIPLISISSASLLADALRSSISEDTTIVAPDHGAIARCEELRSSLGMSTPICVFKKERSESGVRSELEGEAGRKAIIFDDILDTGSTLVNACRALRLRGTEEIVIAVTHGVFTGDRWREIFSQGVRRLLVTSSIPRISSMDERIITVTCAGLVARQLEAAIRESGIDPSTFPHSSGNLRTAGNI